VFLFTNFGQIWGQAYGDVHTTFHGFSSFATSEHEFTLQPHLSVLHLDTSYVQRYRAATSIFGYELPDANEHPMFYIGVYAAIGLSTAAISILSSATQYTGALRASRVLFKKLLVAVVRATMRWHDVTPQGSCACFATYRILTLPQVAC
jgi:ABC-type multidrug transport system fused ATPase/permease subunit